MTDKDLLYEVASLAEFDACDMVWWRFREGDPSQLDVYVNCNDLFWWGTADMEQVTEENLPMLVDAIRHVEKVSGSRYGNQDDAFLLFCCRVRGMRPQGAYYQALTVHHQDKEEEKVRTAVLWRLFDECGPERETGLGNPVDKTIRVDQP